MVVALGMSTGCAAEDETETEDGSAEALAKAGAIDRMATTALRLAERLGGRDPSILQVPLTSRDEGLPSARFGEWGIALVSGIEGGVRGDGFLLLPRENAPSGSFGLVIADGSSIVAHAAYVPDGAKGAEAAVDALLASLETDARALSSSSGRGDVAPRNVLKVGFKTLRELAAAVATWSSKSGTRTVGRVAAGVGARVGSPIWRDFATLFKTAAGADDYVRSLVAIRKGLGARKVVMVQPLVASEAHVSQGAKAIIQRLAGREKDVALAMPFDWGGVDEAMIGLWALENRVPIVVSGGSDTAGAIVSHWLTSVDAATATRLRRLVQDPDVVALVRPANIEYARLLPRAETFARDQTWTDLRFAQLWALSDEALVARVGALPPGASFDFIETWLRRFETVTQLTP